MPNTRHHDHDDRITPVYYDRPADVDDFDDDYHICAPISDDDTTHYLIAVDHFNTNYVRRPGWHAHDNGFAGTHDHDGTWLWHTHVNESGIRPVYVAPFVPLYPFTDSDSSGLVTDSDPTPAHGTRRPDHSTDTRTNHPTYSGRGPGS